MKQQEVESLVPVSNGYIYWHNVDEMERMPKYKIEHGGDKTLSISILKWTKVHGLPHFSTQKEWVNI